MNMKGVVFFSSLKNKMKHYIYILPFFIYLYSCSNAQNNKQVNALMNAKQVDSSTYVYRFRNKYLDLNMLKFLDTKPAKNCVEIKTENLYANYFDGHADSISYKNRVYKLNANQDIIITENKKVIKTIANPFPKISLDNVTGNSILFSVPGAIFHVLRLNENYGYRIMKYDKDGNLLKMWKIASTIFIRSKNEVESITYLYYFGHTNKEFLLSSDEYKHRAILTVNMADTSTLKKPDVSAAGMILDPNNDSLVGLITYDESGEKLTVSVNNKNWQIDNPEGDNSARTILKDSILIIAHYHSISSGCTVNAYKANTGGLLWKGEVKEMMVAHSEYYNNIYLTLFKDKLILEGIEAGGTYLQVLDFKTGKNLFASMP